LSVSRKKNCEELKGAKLGQEELSPFNFLKQRNYQVRGVLLHAYMLMNVVYFEMHV